jgi:hypothetical protein
MYKLKASVNAKKLHKSKLSKNPLAMEYFEKYPKQINWNGMSENPSPKAIALLKQNLDKVNWKGVCKNPSLEAMRFLANHPNKIDWYIIHDHPLLITFLEILEEKLAPTKFSNLMHKFDWYQISKHPDVFRLVGTEVAFKKFVVKTPYKITWQGLSENPSPTALKMLTKNMDKIHFEGLLRNTNPASLGILMKFLDIGDNRMKYDRTNRKLFAKACGHPDVVRILSGKIHELEWEWGHWKILSANPHAIPLLEANPQKINWSEIYKNPNAGPLIEKYENYPDKVFDFEVMYHNSSGHGDTEMYTMGAHINIRRGGYDWDMWKMLAQNPNQEMVRSIMEKNWEKINWSYLSDHPDIFELSYTWLKTRCDIYREDLMKVAMHPSKIQRLLDMGYEIEDLEDLM